MSDFDWGTGETPRRSARISEKTKASPSQESETPKKRSKKASDSKKENKEKEAVSEGNEETEVTDMEEDQNAEKDKNQDESKAQDPNVTIEAAAEDSKLTNDVVKISEVEPENSKATPGREVEGSEAQKPHVDSTDTVKEKVEQSEVEVETTVETGELGNTQANSADVKKLEEEAEHKVTDKRVEGTPEGEASRGNEENHISVQDMNKKIEEVTESGGHDEEGDKVQP